MRMWIQRTARKYGYEIRKAPFPNFQSAPIFDLALHYLIVTRGDNLTLIQVGANEGRDDDPIRPYILKYPWRAVLIESPARGLRETEGELRRAREQTLL